MNKTIYKITAMKFEDPKDGEAKLTAKYKELHGHPKPAPLCSFEVALGAAVSDLYSLFAEEIQSQFRSLEDM